MSVLLEMTDSTFKLRLVGVRFLNTSLHMYLIHGYLTDKNKVVCSEDRFSC